MGPWADQALARDAQMLADVARHWYSIGPAADRVDRAFDRGVVLADRALAPVGVAPLMVQPMRDPRGMRLIRSRQASRQLSPTSAGSGGKAARRNGRAPPHIVGEQAAAHVVDIVRIAVVGRADGDDRPQWRGPARRDLQALKPPQEIPIIPTVRRTRAGRHPVDRLDASSCSCFKYSSRSRPSDSPVPRKSTRRQA